MFRRLRVLAAFAMVPVVLIASPAHAVSGPWVAVDVGGIGTLPGTNADCHFSIQQSGAGMPAVNTGSGYCTGGPDVTPGWTQGGEAGSSYTVTVYGVSLTGGACGGTGSGTLGQSSANGTIRVAGSMAGTTISTGAPDCALNEVCVSFSEGFDPEGCSAVEVPALAGGPPPPGSGETCQLGTVSGLYATVETVPDGSDFTRKYLHLHYSITGGPEVSTGAWGAMMRTPDTDRGVLSLPKSSAGDVVIDSQYYRNGWPGAWTSPPVSGYNFEIVAYGYPGSINTTPSNFFNGASVVPTGGPDDPIPPVAGSPYRGWTDFGDCRFYFGPKLIDLQGSTQDDPAGDVGTVAPPPPPTDPVAPVLTPPPAPDDSLIDLSWLWSILDAVKSAISRLASAIGGLASSIVNGIRDLFLPSDGFMESKWMGVQNKWDGTSPGKYLDALDSFSSGSTSGCGGLPLDVDLGNGVAIHESIGAACTGPMASAAGITRAVVTAVVAVGGLVACVRAVGSGLGWNPGIGRGDAS